MSGKRHDLYGCNHHHPIKDDQSFVDFGTGRFVADNALIPLLKALNEAGLKTRTHNWSGKDEGGHAFVSIILGPDVRFEIKTVDEIDAARSRFNGDVELLISWRVPGVGE